MWALKLTFAGLWPLIVDWAIPLSAIVGLLALEYFSVAVGTYIPPLAPLLERFRKDLLWLAAVIAICLAWGWHMQRDEKARCVAKANVIVHEVDKAVTDANGNPAMHDKFEVDK